MKYLYVHIPKTAGKFLKKCLDESESKTIFYLKDNNNLLFSNHCSIYFIKKYFSLNNDIVFLTIIRNPYDRVYSIWKFLNKNGELLSIELPKVSSNFSDFLNDLNQGYYDPFYFFASQNYFIRGEDINNIKIFKFEEINTTLKNFFIENNINWLEEKINNTDGFDWNTQYNDEMKEIVYNKYREDFDLFGYSK